MTVKPHKLFQDGFNSHFRIFNFMTNIDYINQDFKKDQDQIFEIENKDFDFFYGYYHEIQFDPNVRSINANYLEVFQYFEKLS